VSADHDTVPKINWMDPRPMVFGVFAAVSVLLSVALVGIPWLLFAFVLSPHRHYLVFGVSCVLALGSLPLIYTALHVAAWLDRLGAETRSSFLLTVYALLCVSIVVAAVLALFSSTYLVFFGNSPARFTVPLDRASAMYFTAGQFTTAGSGIAARSQGAQIVASAQMFVDTLLVVGVIAFVVGNINPRRARTLRAG
jgi:hypothetical protein